MVIGFSLGFGAMFSKTWRVHVIFLNSNNTKRVTRFTLIVLCFKLKNLKETSTL